MESNNTKGSKFFTGVIGGFIFGIMIATIIYYAFIRDTTKIDPKDCPAPPKCKPCSPEKVCPPQNNCPTCPPPVTCPEQVAKRDPYSDPLRPKTIDFPGIGSLGRFF